MTSKRQRRRHKKESRRKPAIRTITLDELLEIILKQPYQIFISTNGDDPQAPGYQSAMAIKVGDIWCPPNGRPYRTGIGERELTDEELNTHRVLAFQDGVDKFMAWMHVNNLLVEATGRGIYG